MPFIIPVAQAIASAITAAIAYVASAIAPLVIAIGGAIAQVAVVVGTAVATAVTTAVSGIVWFAQTTWQTISAFAHWIAEEIDIIYHTVALKLKAIYDTFNAILEVIHFKTILHVHNILYLISPQYRNMMRSVYRTIAEASEALGLGSGFILLALQNTRNLVLDVSSTFGAKYDLAQVTWLSTLQKWLNHFNEHATKYQNDPEALFWDLAELIEKPAIDSAGSFQQATLTSIQKVIDSFANFAQRMQDIGVDLEKLTEDLPNFVRKYLPDVGGIFWDNMNNFLNERFWPTINGINSEISIWQQDLSDAQTVVSSLLDDLKKPGEYVATIDEFTGTEKTQQEDLLATYSNRRLARLIADFTPAYSYEYDDLIERARTPIPPRHTPRVLRLEDANFATPDPGGAAPRSSWFVGDY